MAKKQIKLQIDPTLDEVVKFFDENGFNLKYATHVFNYYNDADWFDKNGTKVINWKQKCRGVWMTSPPLWAFKNSNKIPVHIPKPETNKEVNNIDIANKIEAHFADAFEFYKKTGGLPTSPKASQVLFNFINDKVKVVFTHQQEYDLSKTPYDLNTMKLKFYFDNLINK